MIDESQFDRYFQQWEEKFEEWKRVNVNHPDKEDYLRYLNEFENQRQRIISRREQLKIKKMQQQQNLEQLQQIPKQQQNSGEVHPNENINSCPESIVNRSHEMDPNQNEQNLTKNLESNRKDDLQNFNDKELRKNEKYDHNEELIEQNETKKDNINVTENDPKVDQMDKQKMGETCNEEQAEILNLFPKSDGIPGLDLVKVDAVTEDENPHIKTSTETIQNKLESSDNREGNLKNSEDGQHDNTEELVNSLNDPIFLKCISDAIATIKKKEIPSENIAQDYSSRSLVPSLTNKTPLDHRQNTDSEILMSQLFSANPIIYTNEINNNDKTMVDNINKSTQSMNCNVNLKNFKDNMNNNININAIITMNRNNMKSNFSNMNNSMNFTRINNNINNTCINNVNIQNSSSCVFPCFTGELDGERQNSSEIKSLNCSNNLTSRLIANNISFPQISINSNICNSPQFFQNMQHNNVSTVKNDPTTFNQISDLSVAQNYGYQTNQW